MTLKNFIQGNKQILMNGNHVHFIKPLIGGKLKQRGGGIPYNINSDIHPYNQWSNPYTSVPNPQPNLGLYGGPDVLGNHIVPTTSNLINNQLQSANPPVEALTQYVGSNRLGNNFRATPGVNWYVDSNPELKHNILCTSSKGGSRKKKANKKRRNSRKK